MGFLSGKKKVDAERGILEIKGTMNALTLRIRRLETRMVEEQKKAKDAMSRGDRTIARHHLSIVVDLENRRGRYQQYGAFRCHHPGTTLGKRRLRDRHRAHFQRC